jgi:hypothetical protein
MLWGMNKTAAMRGRHILFQEEDEDKDNYIRAMLEATE